MNVLDTPAMRHPRRLAGLLFGLLLLSACGSDNDAPAREAVRFETAQKVSEPRVLTGDPTSGRCADTSQPCFDGKSDFLNGQRTLLGNDDLVVYSVNTDGWSGSYRVAKTTDSKFPEAPYTDRFHFNEPTQMVGLTGARLFNSSTDSQVVYTCNSLVACSIWIRDTNQHLAINAFPVDTYHSYVKSAVADFTGDGFDDIVVMGSLGDIAVMSAPDGNDRSKPVVFGPAIQRPGVAITVGNFFGTGPVIAVLERSGVGRVDLYFYAVDRVTLALSRLDGQTYHFDGNFTLQDMSMVAGHFSKPDTDQLVIAMPSAYQVDLYTFDAIGKQLNPPRKTAAYATSAARPLMRAGRFNAASPFDAVALAILPVPYGAGTVQMLSFDANMGVVKEGTPSVAGTPFVYDMQVGNFDHQRPDPLNPGKRIRDPNLQLAFLFYENENNVSAVKVSTWEVGVDPLGPPGKMYSLAADATIGVVTLDSNQRSAAFAPVDTQGRSMVLGAPSVVTIDNKAQPTVVLAVPPMHADFIDGKLINFTAAPQGFFTRYKTSDSTQASASSTSKTSWTFSATEKLDVTFAAGDCDIGDCASVENKTSAKQALDGSTKALSGSFSSSALDISQQTGLYDVLWYQDSALTVYIYPVIGKTVCPASTPNCADAQKVPMTVIFAGPDSVNQSKIDAIGVPWYQPPWMPGNLLSYPGTLGQLKAATFDNPDSFQSLTDVSRWRTDTSSAEETASWTQGSKAGSTTSFNQNYSFKNTTSFSSKFGLGGLETFSATGSLSLSGSFGFSNLTDSLTTLTQSSGITFVKKADFPDPNRYGYYVTPYIFGEKMPPTANHLLPPLTTDVQTYGILQSGYVVDPLTAGTIWLETYGVAPDIAFNQPARWHVGISTNDPKDGTCVVFDASSSDVNCVSVADKNPTDPWADEYHWMRGFFITGAEANGAGPQLGSANGGDALLLQARVHNFSTAAMPAGAVVRVRFYAMPWDTTVNKPKAGSTSIVIGTAKVGAIPPFNTTTATPNWLLANQRWDTTGLDGKDFVFWVATWMEDAAGQLIGELPDKGLTAVPGAGIDYAAMAALEQDHGNNVGLYNQVFHIFPKPTSARPVIAAATLPSVEITHVGSEATSIRRDQRTMVAARVRIGENDLTRGLSVRFYDGDPKQGARIFGMQTLPQLSAGVTHDFRVPFRSGECGLHVVHVVAGAGTRFEHEAKLSPINVACS